VSRTGAPPTPTRPDTPLVRFDRVERTVHWATAALFGIVVVTGAALFSTPVVALVGRRALVEQVHVAAGLALPVPFLVGVAGRWGRGLRSDIGRFNRWSPADRDWFRSAFPARGRRLRAPDGLPIGKFNPGQKLNAAFVAGAGIVMLVSGCILRWFRPFPLSWREGATIVHNWLAVAFVLVVAGHVVMALTHPEERRSMVHGDISRAWARRRAPAWLGEEATGPDPGKRRGS